ncbi:MAG: gamma carbonic anhydrase family protein [Alphaproteobacteria bacterium]|nr:gamma carbonic anhydrase family protein [Alphaproteobacteria bacterium]
MTLYVLDGVEPELPEDGDYWVAPSADVIGKVKLESGASVWFGAIVRGDNELIIISEGANVQDASVLHTDPGYPLVLGKNVTVGHRAMLHGCVVGENSLIGMGATVLNGAVIGKNAVIGAGALVVEGKAIPDNALVVGIPGKVVRTLSDEEAAAMAYAGPHYVENQRRYRKGLKAL